MDSIPSHCSRMPRMMSLNADQHQGKRPALSEKMTSKSSESASHTRKPGPRRDSNNGPWPNLDDNTLRSSDDFDRGAPHELVMTAPSGRFWLAASIASMQANVNVKHDMKPERFECKRKRDWLKHSCFGAAERP